MAKKKVRIGIVGSRFAADFHAASFSRHPAAELAAVSAISEERLEQFSKKWNIPSTYTDYNQMLEKEQLDLVSVCLPNSMHHDLAVAAAKAGCHVFCEKPLATSVEDAHNIVRACKDAGVKLFYGEDWCFAPALRRTIEIIEEGGIGEMLYVKAKECHNGTHSPFAKAKETCGGGSLIHLAIHPIGWVLHLLADEGRNKVVEVFAECNSGLEDNYVHKDNGGEDFAMAMMKFANGQRAFIEGNYITVGGMDDKVEIYGTQGNIKVDLTFSSPLTVYSRGGYGYSIEKSDNTLGWTKPAVDEFLNLGYVDELGYCLDCILKDEQPIYGCSGALGVACVEIIAAMYKSSEIGQVVRGNWG